MSMEVGEKSEYFFHNVLTTEVTESTEEKEKGRKFKKKENLILQIVLSLLCEISTLCGFNQ